MSRSAQADGQSLSLMDILNTPALRVELVAIVALTTDALRRDLLAVFEPWKPSDRTADGSATGGTLVDLGVEHEEGTKRRREADNLGAARTQALRRAAITHFDKWQIDVLRRLGEVLNVRPDAIRKARADARASAQAATKARQDRAYLAWANGVEDDSAFAIAPEDGEYYLPEGFESKIRAMPKDRREAILNAVLLLLLSLERYSSHSRVLMLRLTAILRLPESTLTENESKVAEGLLASAAAKMSADESTQRQAAEGAGARRWKIGAATVAGAALIGITGGLAAPILAAGVGSIMGGLGLGAVASLLGPLATNVVLVGGLFGAYGGRMTGRIMGKYAQEIKDFKFVPVSPEQRALGEADDSGIAHLSDKQALQSHKLRVAIGISGSVTGASGFVEPWRIFSPSRIEAFGLQWEMDALLQLGRKMSEVIRSYAWDFAKFKLLSMLLSGLWPFGLLRAARSLDSPFAIAKTRSDKAGKVLADALINHVQGARPVTLVGFGLGARVIYSCLQQLADLNAFGLVESAVLMGTPAPSDAAAWRRMRAVVSGRVVNVFSENDFMLGFLYRASSVQMGIAGVQEIEGVNGIENFDVTELVKSHDAYASIAGVLLHRIGFADLDPDVLKEQQADLTRAGTAIGSFAERQHLNSSQDNVLARSDEAGNIVKVENEKAASMAQDYSRSLSGSKMPANAPEPDSDAEDDDNQHTIRMEDNDGSLSALDPRPEPEMTFEPETVRFGSKTRGFDVSWEEGR